MSSKENKIIAYRGYRLKDVSSVWALIVLIVFAALIIAALVRSLPDIDNNLKDFRGRKNEDE